MFDHIKQDFNHIFHALTTFKIILKSYFIRYRESCVWSRLFETIMEIKPQDCGIWYLTTNKKNIMLPMHYILLR